MTVLCLLALLDARSEPADNPFEFCKELERSSRHVLARVGKKHGLRVLPQKVDLISTVS